MADKTQNVKTRLSFDGEAEYKAACKEINSTLIGAESRRCLIVQNRRAHPLQTLICSWAFYGKNCRDTQQ